MDDGVGARLREARGRREIDLSEVEASTKIRARFLSALENEEWDQLPEDAYVRSFIRTYASYLGLDGERLAEQQRQLSGATRPDEALPHVEPEPVTSGTIGRGPSRRGLAALVAVGLVAALLVVGLSSGGDGSPDSVGPARKGGAEHSDGGSAAPAAARPSGLSLQLAATAEVWVCVLDAKGEELVDGQILGPGSVEGPYRSGSFTVSLGNGEVTMTVDGQQATIPETSSPIGFSIGHGGSMRKLSEGERPTCT
ncbi:MAG: helix-turn-helix transcriptional regulator [Solirubrobacterales bacterium]